MSNARFSITPAAAAADTSLSDSVFRTLACLGVFGDKNGWCWPSLEKLAKMRGVSKPRISQDIKILVERGYVQKEAQFKNKEQQVNRYRVLFDTDGLIPEVNGGLTSGVNGGLISEVNPPLTPEVNQNAPVNDSKNAPIENKTCPIMSSLDENKVNYKRQVAYLGDIINEWKTKHAEEWILKAIAMAAGKSVNYADAILSDWQENGYPKPPKKQADDKTKSRKIRSLD